MKKFSAIFGIGLMAVMLSEPVQASLIITGGRAGSIPGPNTSNDLLSLFGTPNTGPRNGFFGAQLESDRTQLVSVDFFGAEASWINFFFQPSGANTAEFAHPGGTKIATSLLRPLDSFTRLIGPGLLDFAFEVMNGRAENGSNSEDSFPNFFMDIARSSGRSGDTAWIWLDDGGAGPDLDYDDMLVRVSVVPEPATLGLLGSGLIGLGLLRRRRRNNSANKS